MRKELKSIGTKDRHTFVAEFSRFGKKSAFKGEPLTTLLFINVTDTNGNKVTDHLWFTMTKGFQKCDLQEGDVVQFDARVAQYEKGYKGYRYDFAIDTPVDYKLSYPTKIKVIEKAISHK